MPQHRPGRVGRGKGLGLAETLRLSQYWSKLEVIHVAYGLAQQEVETAIGVPICQPDCGRCCAENSISCYGFEAEYVGSCLIGAGLLKEGLDRARAWLTEPGQWTYGSKLNLEKLKELVPELRRASLSPCCFLMDDKKCMIWNSRPMVCRAYGVTRMPGPICPRRLGIGEDFLHRVTWDPDHPKVPVRPLFNSLIGMVREPNYLRQAFLPMMLFQRFRADELAGLAYDGKIPLVKLHVGWGEGISMLWQEQVERDWTAQLADQSIAEQVPLVERDGKLIMTVKDGVVHE